LENSVKSEKVSGFFKSFSFFLFFAMAVEIDGRKIASEIFDKVRREVIKFKEKGHKIKLSIIAIGDCLVAIILNYNFSPKFKNFC
jgi:hypothetical protein